MFCRKFWSRAIYSINKIRNRSDESRKTDKTTSSSLQQNFHFEFCKKLSLCRSAIQCRTSQYSQIRLIVFKFKFTIDMFHLLIKISRNLSRLEDLLRVSCCCTEKTNCAEIVFNVCDCSWIFNNHSNSSKFHSKSSFDVVTWNTSSSISCKICIFVWDKCCIFAWNWRCIFFKTTTSLCKRARTSSISCCKRSISTRKWFNFLSFFLIEISRRLNFLLKQKIATTVELAFSMNLESDELFFESFSKSRCS